MALNTFLFDLDGTLIDSAADLAAAVNHLRVELNLLPLDLPTICSYVGEGAQVLVSRSLPPGAFTPERLQRFLHFYGEHLTDTTIVYPGIREFLVQHRGDRLAVITNKPLDLSLELLRRLDLLSFFPLVLGAESAPEKKPHPAPVLLALERLDCQPEHAVMIGDHHTDLRAGRAAGVKTCFCSWGMGSDGGLPSDFRAAAPADLLRLFPAEAP